MMYNKNSLDKQNIGAFCIFNTANTVIKYCGQSALHDRTHVLTVCLSNGRYHGGHFVMVGDIKSIKDKNTKICVVCGTSYSATRSDQIYCSGRCASKAWREANYNYTYLRCKYCGKKFKRLHSSQKYCSAECRYRARLRRRYPEDGPGKGWSAGMTLVEHEPNVVCDMCGEAFFKRPCYLARGHENNFCSNECRTKYIGVNVSSYPNSSKRSNIGTREDLGLFVRSSWEANYARYLNWLIEQGEIEKWEYEVDTFEFEPIKRGTRFYTPDFKIFNNDGSVEYHEVKGYMDSKSKTKLKRMAKYYPDIEIVLIDKDVYYSIASQCKNLIENWE